MGEWWQNVLPQAFVAYFQALEESLMKKVPLPLLFQKLETLKFMNFIVHHFLISGVSKVWITRCGPETVWRGRSKIYVILTFPWNTLYSGLTQTEIEIGPSCPPPSVRPRSGSVPSSSIRMAQLQGDKIHTKLEEVWNYLTSSYDNLWQYYRLESNY